METGSYIYLFREETREKEGSNPKPDRVLEWGGGRCLQGARVRCDNNCSDSKHLGR